MTAEASWRELVEQHGEAILKVAFRVLRNIHDAEDIAQQVLLEAFAMEKLPDIGIMKRMAAFRSIDRLRRRDNVLCFDETVHVPFKDDAERSIEIQEQADLLRIAIARLPNRQAQCFWLRYVEGLCGINQYRECRRTETEFRNSDSALFTCVFTVAGTLGDGNRMVDHHRQMLDRS